MKKSVSVWKSLFVIMRGADFLLFVFIQVWLGAYTLICSLKITEYLYITDDRAFWSPFLRFVFWGSLWSLALSVVKYIAMKFFAQHLGEEQQEKRSDPSCQKEKAAIRLLKIEGVVLVFGTFLTNNLVLFLYQNKVWFDNTPWVSTLTNSMTAAAAFQLFAIQFQIDSLKLRI